MNSVSPNSSPSSVLSFLNPRTLRPYQPSSTLYPSMNRHKEKLGLRGLKRGLCRAELSPDAPFVAAIGACMLSSLVLPTAVDVDDGDDSSGIVSTDTRFAAMGVISFIPYFNWLSWVFAWLDSGKNRYAVYALVYLAPYFRSNLSLSLDETWLPIASILFCIVHVQLEASIRNGDIQGFQLFSEATKHFPSVTRNKNVHFKSNQEKSEEERKSKQTNLPPGQDMETPWWRETEKPKDPQQWKNDWEDEDHRKNH